MRSLKIVLLIAALLAAIFILYNKFSSAPEAGLSPAAQSSIDASVNEAASVAPDADTNAEFSAESANGSSADTPAAQIDSTASIDSDTSDSVEPDNATQSESLAQIPDYPELYGYEVGLSDLSEDDYQALVARLRNDPTLMEGVLNELRAEIDPARIKRLSALLGETGSAALLPVTEELVYSANSDTRKAGLDILSRIAPSNPEAYDIANTILGSEADPELLVSTMNVLARPTNADPEARATAISQIMPLANHHDVAVRRHSVGLLARLTNDETLSPVLYSALSDTDASVREAAVYAYASYPYQTTEAVERLLQMTEDPSEARGVRSGAILALSNMSPDEQMQARLSAAKKQIREAARVK